MRIIILILVFYSSVSLARAPFGLTWGADLSAYGDININGNTITVLTNDLPGNNTRAPKCFLKGSIESGLSLIRISSETYELESTELKDIEKEIREYLTSNDYEYVSSQSGSFSTYQCILHGDCYGNVLHAKSKQGTMVTVMIRGINKKGYVLVEFTAPHLLTQEKN